MCLFSDSNHMLPERDLLGTLLDISLVPVEFPDDTCVSWDPSGDWKIILSFLHGKKRARCAVAPAGYDQSEQWACLSVVLCAYNGLARFQRRRMGSLMYKKCNTSR